MATYGTPSPEDKEPDFLTADEQVKLCRYYEEQIQAICPHLKLSDMVMVSECDSSEIISLTGSSPFALDRPRQSSI